MGIFSYVVVEGGPLFFVLKGVGLCVPSTLVIGGENRTKNYISCFACGSTDIYIISDGYGVWKPSLFFWKFLFAKKFRETRIQTGVNSATQKNKM